MDGTARTLGKKKPLPFPKKQKADPIVNQKHDDKLKEGVGAWNAWRDDNPEVVPDLSGAKLRKADLSGADLSGADLREASLEEANLEIAKLRKADLQEASLRKADLFQADLFQADLSGANLREAKLTGIRYRRLGRCRGILLEGCSGSPMFIRDAKDNEYIEEFADRHKYLYYAWSISSDCGRSIWRWVLCSLILALSFAAVFHLLGEQHFHFQSKISFNWFTEIYYSIVTFTTLGFGDITPISIWAMVFVTAEVIIGYLMLGGLIAILASKLARRAS